MAEARSADEPAHLTSHDFTEELVTIGRGAEILEFLGKPTERAAIDRSIRRLDTYTSPGDMVEYARDRGLAAQFYNKGSWDELKGFVDRGIPIQVLFSPDGSGDLGS